MSKFTPGPWKAQRDEVWVGRRRICAHVGAGESLSLPDDMERGCANARLIAQSPALYAIVERLASMREGLEHGSSAAEHAATKLAAEAAEVVAKVNSEGVS